MEKVVDNKPEISKAQVKAELWRRGILSWKLAPHQKELYNLYRTTKEKTNVWLLGRRSGKSYTLCLLAIEECLREPDTIVKFVAPTKSQLYGYVRTLMRPILEDCPQDLKPEFRTKEYTYFFKNGSEIHLAGSDSQHAEKLRGSAAKLCLVDEAGSCSNLDYVIKSILLPTTLTTNGKIILASTPPPDEEHDFLKFIEAAQLKNTLIKKTIFDNTLLTKDQLEKEIEEAGGVTSEYFRREYMCEIIRNSSTTVIPEFTDELEKAIVKEWPTPPFYDGYVSMDLGGSTDLTVVIFAYYDFRADKIIIEDEVVIPAKEQDYIPKLINSIKKKETALWKNPYTNEIKPPFLRVSDINYIATSEIQRQSTLLNYPISFSQAKKDDKDTAIHNLRVLLSTGKIIINPRCVNTIRHLKNGKWKLGKKEFARSQDDGHYDAIPAMYYLCRHILFGRNPYPANYDLNLKDIYFKNPNMRQTQNQKDMTKVFEKLFNVRKNK